MNEELILILNGFTSSNETQLKAAESAYFSLLEENKDDVIRELINIAKSVDVDTIRFSTIIRIGKLLMELNENDELVEVIFELFVWVIKESDFDKNMKLYCLSIIQDYMFMYNRLENHNFGPIEKLIPVFHDFFQTELASYAFLFFKTFEDMFPHHEIVGEVLSFISIDLQDSETVSNALEYLLIYVLHHENEFFDSELVNDLFMVLPIDNFLSSYRVFRRLTRYVPNCIEESVCPLFQRMYDFFNEDSVDDLKKCALLHYITDSLTHSKLCLDYALEYLPNIFEVYSKAVSNPFTYPDLYSQAISALSDLIDYLIEQDIIHLFIDYIRFCVESNNSYVSSVFIKYISGDSYLEMIIELCGSTDELLRDNGLEAIEKKISNDWKCVKQRSEIIGAFLLENYMTTQFKKYIVVFTKLFEFCSPKKRIVFYEPISNLLNNSFDPHIIACASYLCEYDSNMINYITNNLESVFSLNNPDELKIEFLKSFRIILNYMDPNELSIFIEKVLNYIITDTTLLLSPELNEIASVLKSIDSGILMEYLDLVIPFIINKAKEIPHTISIPANKENDIDENYMIVPSLDPSVMILISTSDHSMVMSAISVLWGYYESVQISMTPFVEKSIEMASLYYLSPIFDELRSETMNMINSILYIFGKENHFISNTILDLILARSETERDPENIRSMSSSILCISTFESFVSNSIIFEKCIGIFSFLLEALKDNESFISLKDNGAITKCDYDQMDEAVIDIVKAISNLYEHQPEIINSFILSLKIPYPSCEINCEWMLLLSCYIWCEVVCQSSPELSDVILAGLVDSYPNANSDQKTHIMSCISAILCSSTFPENFVKEYLEFLKIIVKAKGNKSRNRQKAIISICEIISSLIKQCDNISAFLPLFYDVLAFPIDSDEEGIVSGTSIDVFILIVTNPQLNNFISSAIRSIQVAYEKCVFSDEQTLNLQSFVHTLDEGMQKEINIFV